MEEDWEEELSKFLSAMVGFLGLMITGGPLSVPGSMKRGAGDLFLADFLRSLSIVEGAGLLDLELLSLELGDLLGLLRLPEVFPFLAMLETREVEGYNFFRSCWRQLGRSLALVHSLRVRCGMRGIKEWLVLISNFRCCAHQN